MTLLAFKCTLVCLVALFCLKVNTGQISSDTWVQIAPPVNPPTSRHSHTAVFNPVGGSMVVFGGTNNNLPNNEIGIYTVNTDLWALTYTISGVPPAPRYGHTAVVTGLVTMVVFGGQNETDYFNDIAVFDLVSSTWLNITTTGSPPPRAYHTAVVDRYQHAMYVYGGEYYDTVYSDMWVLNLDSFTWSQIDEGASVPRTMHTALMTLQGIMVFYGGVGLSDVTCFNVRNNSWYSCVTPASPAPSVRYGHSVVYSPLQQMVVFGGRNENGSPVNEVWNLDLNTFEWHTGMSGSGTINPRWHHSATATAFGTMIIFGGIDGDSVITSDFGLYNMANTILRSANDGIVLVIMITLLGTILLALCYAMDYMKEQNEIEKDEAVQKAKQDQFLLLPKLPAIPKALQIPLGPRAQKFFDEFKVSLDPMRDPPK